MDAHAISRLRERFERMTQEERHFTHRHLLDVMRTFGDASLTDNSDHIGSRISQDEKTLLQLLAAARGSTTSAVIRDAIRDYIKRTTLHLERTADDNTRH